MFECVKSGVNERVDVAFGAVVVDDFARGKVVDVVGDV